MLPKFFSDIVNGIWAIEKSYADSYIPLLTNILEGKTDIIQPVSYSPENNEEWEFQNENRKKKNIRYLEEINDVYVISEYGSAAPPEKAPKNSIAIINVTDAITKYDQYCGPSGTQTKQNLLQRADANPNIKGIILNIDSPGGEGYAALEFARIIGKAETPIMGFVDDLAASAGYWILSSTDIAVANSPMARVGSIGTYVTLADYEEFYKMKGLRLLEIYADKSSDKNKAYYDAIKNGDFSLVKAGVNKFNEAFLGAVATLRDGKVPEEKIWGTGKLFSASDAMEIGLIDDIMPWEEAIMNFANSINL